MGNHVNAEVGCEVVADFVDEAEVPTTGALHKGEVVRPRVVADCVDLWGRDDGMREFSVLLRDGRVVAVRGHSLKHEPHAVAGQDVFSIVVRTETEEVLVALFKSADVAGIFHGELQAERRIA